MSYELEYVKSYDGRTLTVTPIKGRDDLPTLSVEIAPEDVDSAVFYHRTRTIDIGKPGVTALVFGVPGKVQIVHHDGEIVTVDSHEEALGHERPGEYDILRSAYERQTS